MLISDWSSDVCSSDLTKIYSHVGWTGEFVYLPFDKKVLKQGKNLLAIHVANTAGGAWLDAGIVNEPVREGKPVLEARQQSVRVGDRKSTTSELQSLMRISYAVLCLKKKNKNIEIVRKNDK